jgi:hypothetical protein
MISHLIFSFIDNNFRFYNKIKRFCPDKPFQTSPNIIEKPFHLTDRIKNKAFIQLKKISIPQQDKKIFP